MNVLCDLLILVVASTLHQCTSLTMCMSSHDLVHEMICANAATMRDVLPCNAKQLIVSSRADGTSIACGTVIKRYLVAMMPSVKLPHNVQLQGGSYVLMIVDRDAPSRQNPKSRYLLHILMADVPLWFLENKSQSPADNGSTLNVLTVYAAPSPTAGSGHHRIQIFVLKKPATPTKPIPQPITRSGFDVQQFVNSNQLCNTGSLVGAFEYVLNG